MVFFLIGSSLLQKSPEKTWHRIQMDSGISGPLGVGKPMDLEKETFRMGNLDFLWYMENQLSKLETQIESNFKKIEKQVEEIDKTHGEFLIESRGERKPVEIYIYQFKWDDSRYPRSNLSHVDKRMSERVSVIEGDFRNRTQIFNDRKNALHQLNKKEGSSFLTKDLADILKYPIVTDEDFVYSGYLTTAVVVVPKLNIRAFQEGAESIHESIVPGSVKQFRVEGDDNYTLWRIIYFRSSHDEITNQLRSLFKATLREFCYDAGESENREARKRFLQNETGYLTKHLLDVCFSYYSDLYITYVHVKVLRLLIDSVLRYGVREKIFTCVMKPKEGKEKKLHEGLTNIFSDPNEVGLYGDKDEIGDSEDFYPYAFVQIYAPEKKNK